MNGVVSFANRGTALEELIVLANQTYRNQKTAIVHKVPTQWLPIRGKKPGGKSKIVSAKVEKKAAVDFLGHILLPEGRPLPLAFDAKEVSKGDRWPLANLHEHQYEYLRDSALTGAFSFVLLGFWQYQMFYILPFSELEVRWNVWKFGGKKKGKASVQAGEQGLIKVEFMDYLGGVNSCLE
jgi:recombination protein U